MNTDNRVHVQLVDFLWDNDFNRKNIGKPICLSQVPRVDEYISSGNKAYRVNEIIHVENDTTRVVVTPCDKDRGSYDRPDIARLSDPNR